MNERIRKRSTPIGHSAVHCDKFGYELVEKNLSMLRKYNVDNVNTSIGLIDKEIAYLEENFLVPQYRLLPF